MEWSRYRTAPAWIVNSRAKFEQWQEEGLRSETCVALDVNRGLQVVTGTEYSGEMKKGAFSMMNYLLPLEGIPAKFNLIPFNAWPGAPYECSTPERVKRFSEIVFDHGISAPVRTPRGRDIMAACGQLKSETERARKSRAQIAAETGL